MSAAATPSPRDRRLGLIAAYACVFGTTVGLGLTLPLLPLEIERAGYSAFFNGLNGTIGGLALLLTAPLVPAIAARVGPINMLLVSFLLAATCLALIPVTPVWVWFPLRFVLNVALQSLFVVSEVWINTLASERNRGRLIGLYGALATGGFAAGPALAAQFPEGSAIPFWLGSAAILIGLAPVLAARAVAPAIAHASLRGIAAILAISAIPILAALAHAVTETAATSFLPVFAVREGWLQADALFLITAFGLGNVLLQIPIGWLADKIDRIRLLGVCAVLGCIGGLLLPLAAHDPTLLIILAFFWGGALIGIYTIGLTLVGQVFQGAALAPASAAFAFAYALGSILGPGPAGLAMDLAGNNGLGWFIASICAAYAILIMMRRRA
ncbi:MAG: MFS transporter [Micropepsaceae bacterium]